MLRLIPLFMAWDNLCKTIFVNKLSYNIKWSANIVISIFDGGNCNCSPVMKERRQTE
jgi:hypothetical protein